VGKIVNDAQRVNELVIGFKLKSPKEMRTFRNALNNRIKSFTDEATFGKELPKLSPSHKLYGFNLSECKVLLEQSKKELKAR
jgi:hypothetical protein